ncbi:MAG: ParB/RepB/Spo0J family partition protein [Actinomycetes bacterium]
MDLRTIPVDLIDAHPNNVRRHIGNVDDLAKSIKAQGILQPLVVVPEGDRYLLIAGRRRLAAARQAGNEAAPCVVRDIGSKAAQIEMMLVENLQRRDLTPTEEAAAYSQLELLGVPVAHMAQATGITKSTIEARMRLMDLPEKHRERVDEGQLTLGDADILARLSDDAEALAYIGDATGANLKWKVQQWPAEKARRAELAAAPKPVKSKSEVAAKARADQDAAAEARKALNEARKASNELRLAWVREQISLGSTTFWDAIAQMVYLDVFADEPELIDLFGLKPDGDDNAPAVSGELAGRIALLHYSEMGSPSFGWNFYSILKAAIGAGYEPSDAELELLAGVE